MLRDMYDTTRVLVVVLGFMASVGQVSQAAGDNGRGLCLCVLI